MAEKIKPRQRDGRDGSVMFSLVNFPTTLKRRLIAKARKRKTNVNDVAVEALAAHFDVPFTPTGRWLTSASDSGTVMFRMPIELRRRIKHAAIVGGISASAVVVNVLRQQFRR